MRPISEVGGSTEPIEAAYRVAGEAVAEVALVPLATMVEELRGLANQLAELAQRNEGLVLEVGTFRECQRGYAGQLAPKDATLTMKDETIAELHRRAEAEAARQQEEAAELRAILHRQSTGFSALIQEAPRSWWRRMFGGGAS